MNGILVTFYVSDHWPNKLAPGYRIIGYEIMSSVPCVGEIVRIADHEHVVRERSWELYPKPTHALADQLSVIRPTGMKCLLRMTRVPVQDGRQDAEVASPRGIWLVTKGGVLSDEFVIVAGTDAAARAAIHDERGCECSFSPKPWGPCAWSLATCTRIGDAADGAPDGIVLRDYRDG